MNKLSAVQETSLLHGSLVNSLNHRTSNITDHVLSDQHKTAMTKLRADQAKASNKSITAYSPLARSLLTLDEVEI